MSDPLLVARVNSVARLAGEPERIAENAEKLQALVDGEMTEEKKSPFAIVEKVTIFWRPYGDEIEWRAEMEPAPFTGYQRLYSWHVVQTLAHAGYELLRGAPGMAPFAKVEVVREDGERRRPRLSRSDDFVSMSGAISEDGLDVEFGGACPIQGQGTLDGRICYYRARGSGWSFEAWPPGVSWGSGGELPDAACEFEYDRAPYAWPDGGWLHRDESLANLREALSAWKARPQ